MRMGLVVVRLLMTGYVVDTYVAVLPESAIWVGWPWLGVIDTNPDLWLGLADGSPRRQPWKLTRWALSDRRKVILWMPPLRSLTVAAAAWPSAFELQEALMLSGFLDNPWVQQ
jgi:hypothetical protein